MDYVICVNEVTLSPILKRDFPVQMLLGVMKNRGVGIAMAIPAITKIPCIRERTIGKTESRMKEVYEYEIKIEIMIFPRRSTSTSWIMSRVLGEITTSRTNRHASCTRASRECRRIIIWSG